MYKDAYRDSLAFHILVLMFIVYYSFIINHESDGGT